MLRRILLLVLITASAIAGLLLISVVAEKPMHHHRAPNTQVSGKESKELAVFAEGMELGMNKMMADMHRPGMIGNADVDFLAMMIPHHEGAIEMARLILIYGTDPLVRQLAEEIIAAQQAEIAAMQGRLSILKQGANPNPGNFPAIGGNRGVSVSTLTNP